MKVSVVISTYNRPEKLKRAIESVIAQTYTDWELIVVNDGYSQLGQVNNLLLGLKDDRLKLLPPAEHFGCDTLPKNLGIQTAQGEYIAFLDDDNSYRPDHLAALVKELEADPELDLVYGDRWVTDEADRLKPQMGVTSNFQPGLLLDHNYIDTSDVLVKRWVLMEVGGFDERYRKFIDWNLWLRLEKAGKKFKRVPLILTDYYLHKSSKSETDPRTTPEWDSYDLEIQLPYLGAVPEPRVAIFSLTYDRLEYTKKCFESLYKTAEYKFDHFVVDNGSTDGTVEWLQEWTGFRIDADSFKNKLIHTTESPGKTVVYNQQNRGISVASNQALDRISKASDSYDIIVKVDNDCLFLTDGWLAKMVEIWKSNRKIALSPFVQGLRDNPGGAPRIGYGQIKGEVIGTTKHIGGICCFADASAYKDFRWDENDFLHSMQDVEFSQHLLSLGYNLGYIEGYFCEHYEGTQGQEKRYPDYFKRRTLEKQTRYEKNH